MFDNLIPNLTTLILTVRRNMLSSVMTTFMIIAIIVAWSARGNFSEWVLNNPSAQQQTRRVVRGVESDKKIETALRRDLQAINADRVLIRRYSDQLDTGTSSIIRYVTATHVVVSPGVSTLPVRAISMPRSYLADVSDPMYADPQNPVCVHLLMKDIKNEFYRSVLEESGSVDQYACPIADIDGTPVGMIIASYLTSTKLRPSDEIVYSTLTDTGVRVAGYVSEVTSPERDVWWRKLLDY